MLFGQKVATVIFCVAAFRFAAFYGEKVTNRYLLHTLLIIPFFEFILCILMRFGIYPIRINGLNASFLATIGNIDWLTAYLAIFVPLGVGLGYVCRLFSRAFFACGIYSFFGILALILQGSDSAVVVMAVCCLLLLLLSFDERIYFKKFMAEFFILGLAMECAAFLLIFFEERYTYEIGLFAGMSLHHVGAVIMALAFFLYRLSTFFEVVQVSWKGKIYFYISAALAVAALIIASVYFIRGFDLSFGNGRGLIWSISADIYKSLSSEKKIFGIGQDCFYSYAYSVPEIRASLMDIFGANALTNAHSDALTLLIERGIFGFLSYFTLVGIFFYRAIKNKKEHAAIVCMLPVICCFVNSMTGFSLVVSTPYMFILMGLGLERKTNVS